MYRILELNPQLQSFAGDIDLRMFLYRSTKGSILTEGQTLNDFANAHEYYGIHHVDGGWVYREWAPSAYQLYLEGEFNNWNQTSHPLTNLGDGNWELFLEGDDALWDGCKVKTVVTRISRARIPFTFMKPMWVCHRKRVRLALTGSLQTMCCPM